MSACPQSGQLTADSVLPTKYWLGTFMSSGVFKDTVGRLQPWKPLQGCATCNAVVKLYALQGSRGCRCGWSTFCRRLRALLLIVQITHCIHNMDSIYPVQVHLAAAAGIGHPTGRQELS